MEHQRPRSDWFAKKGLSASKPNPALRKCYKNNKRGFFSVLRTFSSSKAELLPEEWP